jgi:hypothetical protein
MAAWSSKDGEFPVLEPASEADADSASVNFQIDFPNFGSSNARS